MYIAYYTDIPPYTMKLQKVLTTPYTFRIKFIGHGDLRIPSCTHSCGSILFNRFSNSLTLWQVSVSNPNWDYEILTTFSVISPSFYRKKADVVK